MRLLIKRSFILLTPLVLLVSFFLIMDPLKIIHNYTSPVEKGVLMNDRVFQYDYLKNNSYKYDSFILGSSRSKAFKTDEWSKYINSDKVFHMGVNDETLFGIAAKINFLQLHTDTLKNILIILDHRILSLTKNHSAHIFREHPAISGETYGEFYKKFILAFFKPDFLKAYIHWLFTKEYTPDMKNYIFKEDFEYNSYTGDVSYSGYVNAIKNDSIKYYQDNRDLFYKRDPSTLNAYINSEAEQILKRMAAVLHQNRINYKVIITPNYDQKKLSYHDLMQLKKIFGKNHVSDFSGINRLTDEIGNYYEEKHFKQYIASHILQQVYQSRPQAFKTR